jgi:hypothetical protein
MESVLSKFGIGVKDLKVTTSIGSNHMSCQRDVATSGCYSNILSPQHSASPYHLIDIELRRS